MRFPKVSTTNINGLPLGYTEVEYLESSGTQYIDTGISPSGNTSFVLCSTQDGFDYNSGTTRFGSKISEGNSQLAILTAASNTFRIDYGTGSTSQTNWTPATTKKVKKFDLDATTHTITITYIDDTTTTHTWSSSIAEFTSTVPLLIFAYKNGSTVYYATSMKVSLCKIYDNGTLVRDYIPALDPSGKPCMYDRVEGKPYYNQGTGEFSYGKKIYGVEYLGFTGAEYIQTDFDTTNATSFKYKVKFAIDETVTKTESRIISNEGAGSGMYFDIYYALSTDKLICRPPAAATANTITHNKAIIFEYDNTIGKIQGYYEDDPSTLIYNQSATFTAPTVNVNYRIGCRGNNTGSNYLLQGKIYSVYFERENKVRDFIPVKDENGIGYMLDKVTHTLYENKGTGAFVVGKDTLGKSKAKLIRTKTTVSGLPYGYTEVEYLESNGNQYIDTGIQPTDTYGYRVRNTYTAGAGEQCAIGSMDSGNRFVGIYTSGNANGISGAWGDYVGFLPSYTWATGTILDVKGNYKNNRKLIIDSTEMKDISDSHISGTIENTVYLFARHYGSTVTKMRGRIYSAEITNGQDVINKFIPALDSSNRPCMYDIVEGKAYYNQGTGEFTYGPKIIPVDYLQSSGTQYIDTGYKPNNNTEYEVSGYMNPSGVFGVARWSGEPTYDTFGAHSVTANPLDYYGRYSDSKYHNGPASVFNNNIIWKHTKNNISITNADNGIVYVNENITTATFQSTYNMWIFAFNNMGSILARSVGCKMHYFKIWDNGTLIRDYIPVKDENGVGYMYDKIGHTLYANAGTGSFVVGDEKRLTKVRFIEDTSEISKYTKLKCLISSGTQYINTGVSGNNSKLKIEVDATNYEFGWCHQNNASGAWVDAFSFPSDSKERVNYGNYSSVKDFNYDRTTRKIRTFDFQTGFYIDGVLGQSFTISNYSSLTPSLPLFARYDFNSSSYTVLANSAYTIYGCRIWDGINMIRNFVPVIRNSDNKPGMYDRVTKTFFTNQGTGEFTYETL